ncbi:gamma-glutamylcyclotransferase [Stappia indica]|uniref:glutathione-specific gamma-glutamylcyclotransferase n=1 Tax=Stappia indica TaxID=538381 RepID=A0A857C826_9HYPH|nr:gamma-glutamylcyclotransferase [Stappia indica]QGZ35134.1 gamma-glutamylcyclotransferase [Stappia indica]
MQDRQDLWVFGYGSLMWRPGFEYEDAVQGVLHGAHRSLCIYSWVHRGTETRPGLVLGLDRGGACRGMAFRVAARRRDEVIAYLREREQATMVYREAHRRVRLEGLADRQVTALTYVVDRTHPQYAGVLSLERQLELVSGAVGQSGANPDYVLNTVDHLSQIGIRDHGLEALGKHLRQSMAPQLSAG